MCLTLSIDYYLILRLLIHIRIYQHKHGTGRNTECLKMFYTHFETLFLNKEMRQKYNLCCVIFLKLPYARTCSECPLSATVHSQQWRRTERHTVRIVVKGISLLSSKIRWTLDLSIPISLEHCLNDFFFWGLCKNLHDSISSLLINELLFLPHRLFNTSCTVRETSNLSRIPVIVTPVVGGVPNSTLQRRWTSTTFSTLQ